MWLLAGKRAVGSGTKLLPLSSDPATTPCLRLTSPPSAGASYVLMGRAEADGTGQLPPTSFVVPFRPQQQQLLTNLSRRPCTGLAARNRS